ncbi:putative cellulose-binding protein [Phaeoacremonium minimum UCRPA7]|uniref:Putative cellulose-binding protein n=1 Tax=Phaeoacremonium minimum (strain UCR-PA7) TaxID=1286976 RepID=R8BTE3_PHAM7|nr:putative cellulose-binding protein [Phaeoacremonium minimum UCRPA7]EOO02647.1 putative cellulose-binding protein [Phaeoacremonium minimum UCRPA7]
MTRMLTFGQLGLLASSYITSVLGAQNKQCSLDMVSKPRLFVLTDIANEPDDAQSLVRLMVYANEFDIQGIVATTSVWLNDTTRPDQIHDIVSAYGEVLPNLRKHADGWPDVDYLQSVIASGLPVYGMDGVGGGKDSTGSNLLIKAVDASSEPLWIPVWGGASVLAQALWHVNNTRSAAEAEAFASKVRVYAISDQDNTGVWIRRHWPRIFYIASVHHFNRYAVAAWGGISGDDYYYFPSAIDRVTVSRDWLQSNIQKVSALGVKYPDADFIVEGDTPSLLYVIPNGLSDPEHPEWGSWGGRYGPVNYGEGHFADSVDIITDDEDNSVFMGSHVTVWRWRNAFQHDFAARMQWTAQSKYGKAKHAPVAVLDGDRTRNVIKITAEPGQTITLDARDSCSPDASSGKLAFKWWQYREPSSNNNNPKRDVPKLELDNTTSSRVTVTMPAVEQVWKQGRNTHPEADKHLHLILEVSKDSLVSYRRILFTILGTDTLNATQGKGVNHDEL